MRPLYQLASEYQKILDVIDESEDITPEHLEQLNSINNDINQKSANVGLAIKNIDCMLDGIQKEVALMSDRYKKLNKKREWLINYLKYNMQSSDIRKVQSSNIEINLRDYKYTLDIYDTGAIPAKYYKEKRDILINKKSIIEDLKQGEVINGAKFMTTTSVNIK